MLNYQINKLNIAQIFFLLFLASVFFPVRYVIPTSNSYILGFYSDFTAISLYLSDIFLFITWCFCFLPRDIGYFWLRIKDYGLWILLLWLILGLIWHYQTNNVVIWWYSLKYAEFIVAYGTSYYLFSKTDIKVLFFKLFALFSSFEALLAVWQFITQKSLGLNKLGEQVLSQSIVGVSKVVSGGTSYIRGYGTFPHPNVLSAFLVAGGMICLYLFMESKSLKARLFYGLTIIIHILGLTVSFSRAGYLSFVVGIAIYFGYYFVSSFKFSVKQFFSNKQITAAIIAISLGVIISFVAFRPFLLTRATVTDDSSLQRIFYAKIAVKMMAKNPIFGLGIGESVIHMQQFTSLKLWPWQIQPIHNYFLLAGAELGIPGLLIFVWIFFSHFWGLIKKLKASHGLTTNYLLLTTILCIFLVLMQFDHYFYTLQQTQILLWIILGTIGAELKNPSSEGLAKR